MKQILVGYARGGHEEEIYKVIVEKHQREHRPGTETPQRTIIFRLGPRQSEM